jgi:hypothetical protein
MQEYQKAAKSNISPKIFLKAKEKRPIQNRIYEYRLALDLLLDVLEVTNTKY